MSDHSKMTAMQVREEQDRIELAERARLRELSGMPCSECILNAGVTPDGDGGFLCEKCDEEIREDQFQQELEEYESQL